MLYQYQLAGHLFFLGQRKKWTASKPHQDFHVGYIPKTLKNRGVLDGNACNRFPSEHQSKKTTHLRTKLLLKCEGQTRETNHSINDKHQKRKQTKDAPASRDSDGNKKRRVAHPLSLGQIQRSTLLRAWRRGGGRVLGCSLGF